MDRHLKSDLFKVLYKCWLRSKRNNEFWQIIKNILQASLKTVFLRGVSLIRPAPAELPQDRKVARVGSCSGAI